MGSGRRGGDNRPEADPGNYIRLSTRLAIRTLLLAWPKQAASLVGIDAPKSAFERTLGNIQVGLALVQVISRHCKLNGGRGTVAGIVMEASVQERAMGRVALLAGASGLVGREILAAILADDAYAAVHCVGRRALATTHPKLSVHVLDFAALAALPAVDDVFIALGTTIKVAGSQPAFRAVDFDAVLALAQAARSSGASRLGVVSAMGANEKSPIFYNRVKGEMERAVSRLGFDSLVFARPSMLIGDRESLGQPGRSGERLALIFMKFDALIPANYRAIEAARVARALVRAVKTAEKGTRVLLSGDMQTS